MPLVAFSSLPLDARVWVFGSAEELTSASESELLETVDEYLDSWSAHGCPLTVARDWRDGRFLAIAVDQRDENASGCSLDALFRVLRGLEARLGTSLLGNARVYYRSAEGAIRVTDRAGFAEHARSGAIESESRIFDFTVQTVGEWTNRFETTAKNSWHGALLAEPV